MITKVVLETDKPTKLQRFNEQEKMVGERIVDYEDLIRIIIGVSPVAVIIDYLERERLECVKEYMETIIDAEGDEEGLIYILSRYLIDHMDRGEVLKLVLDKFGYLMEGQISEQQAFVIISHWLNEFSKLIANHQELNEKLLKQVIKNSNKNELKQIFSLLTEKTKEYEQMDQQQFQNIVKAGIVTLPLEEKLSLVQEHIGKPKVFVKVAPKADYIVSDGDETVYLYDIKKQKIRVRLAEVPYNDVGHPRLLFAIRVNKKGTVLNAKCAALKGKGELTMNTPLYRYPYSNVFDNGDICWSGYRSLPVDQIPNGFLSTSNNTHLCSNIRELFEKYQNKAFNERDLKRLGALTIYDWC